MLFELIDDLKELELIQGTHNGRWQDELDQEDSAKDYLKEMKKFADKYKVSYAPILKDNFDSDYWKDEDFDSLRNNLLCQTWFSCFTITAHAL